MHILKRFREHLFLNKLRFAISWFFFWVANLCLYNLLAITNILW